MLHEPAASLTDLALGLVVVTLALGLRRAPEVHRYWRTTFWWVGLAALAGAVHHGFVTRSERWAELSWALISCMVVVGISYLLAATVEEVLGPGRGRVFWILRSLSLVAYAALAATGHAGIGAILACEGVTMVAVIALWVHGARIGHPLALPALAALAASSAAGATRAMPGDVTAHVGLDPTSLYHVAQIPGMLMLYGTLVGAAVVPRVLRARRSAA
jgi:hypothetical protein